MAYISGKYTSATEYSITLGGMAIGTVYAILVQDLNADGSSNGFVCKWKSGATSSTYTDDYTTSATYSRYDRRIGFFQGSFNTKVGTVVSDANFDKWADGQAVIKAWGGGGGGPTPKKHYYYQVKLYGNGGVFSDGSKTYTTYWWPKDDVASSETTSPKVDTSDFPSPTRNGYRLTGWAKTSNGTPTSPLTFTAKSTDADNPTLGNEAYAIWQVRPHIILDANGGKFDGTLSTKDFYINYGDGLDFSRYKPSWYGEGSYTLIGWAENPNSTSPTYGVNEVIGPLYGAGPYKYYAVWQKSRATLTFYGNGGLWYGNLQKQSETYDVGETVSFTTYSNDLVRAGYSLLGWSTSPTATDAPWDPNGIVTVGATDADYYAVWQKHIDLFYWYGNDTQDAAKIAKGQPVTNLTATIWNEFKSRINQLTIAETGRSWSYSDVLPGDSITAAEVLAARNALAALNNNVPLPTANQLQTGKQILASYFNGTGSLKAALNIIINNYNKS